MMESHSGSRHTHAVYRRSYVPSADLTNTTRGQIDHKHRAAVVHNNWPKFFLIIKLATGPWSAVILSVVLSFAIFVFIVSLLALITPARAGSLLYSSCQQIVKY